MSANSPCPCGSARDYSACCGRYHTLAAWPPTAEELMRARYSAYVMGLEDYLRTSWHPDRCPQAIELQAQPRPTWLGLTLKAHRLLDDDHATVEFVARYKLNGRAYRLHEISRFERISGRWVYVDGDEKD